MLGKMLVHGLLSAAVIAGAGVVYAQASSGNGYLQSEQVQARDGQTLAFKAEGAGSAVGGVERRREQDARPGKADERKDAHRGRDHDDDDD